MKQLLQQLFIAAGVSLLMTLPACNEPGGGEDEALVLITPEQYREATRNLRDVAPLDAESITSQVSGDTQGPKIELRKPALAGRSLAAPFEVELTWIAEPGATIDLDSLNVTYEVGNLNDDKTALVKRCRSFIARALCRLDDRGLYIKRAELPAGSHKIHVSIADSKHRRTSRLLAVTVQEPQ